VLIKESHSGVHRCEFLDILCIDLGKGERESVIGRYPESDNSQSEVDSTVVEPEGLLLKRYSLRLLIIIYLLCRYSLDV
jgi:hypothetical protein